MSASARCRSSASSSSASGTSVRPRHSRTYRYVALSVRMNHCAASLRCSTRCASALRLLKRKCGSTSRPRLSSSVCETCLFRARAAQSIAFPVAKQEHGLVNVGDGDDEGDDGEERRGQRVLARPGVSCRRAPDPEKRGSNRDRVEADDRQEQAEPAPGPQQPVLAARQPEVQPPVALPDDEGHHGEPCIGRDQPACRMPRVIDQARQGGDESAENRARQQSRPEVMHVARVESRPGSAVVHPGLTVSVKPVRTTGMGRTE